MKKKKFVFTAVLLVFGALVALILSFAVVQPQSPTFEYDFLTSNVLNVITGETVNDLLHGDKSCNISIKGYKPAGSGGQYFVRRWNIILKDNSAAGIVRKVNPRFGEFGIIETSGNPSLADAILFLEAQGMVYGYSESYKNSFNLANCLLGATMPGTLYVTAHIAKDLGGGRFSGVAIIQAKVYILGDDGEIVGVEGRRDSRSSSSPTLKKVRTESGITYDSDARPGYTPREDVVIYEE